MRKSRACAMPYMLTHSVRPESVFTLSRVVPPITSACSAPGIITGLSGKYRPRRGTSAQGGKAGAGVAEADGAGVLSGDGEGNGAGDADGAGDGDVDGVAEAIIAGAPVATGVAL